MPHSFVVITSLSAIPIYFYFMISLYIIFVDVKKSNLKYANVFLYIWILITFVICIIDLVMFIFFVLDYDTLFTHSSGQSLNFANAASSILLSAQVSSSIMYSVALRGYLLWAINMGITLYLFTQTFKIYDYNKLTEAGVNNNNSNVYMNNAFKNDEMHSPATINNQPIMAYELKWVMLDFLILSSPKKKINVISVPTIQIHGTTT